MSLKPDDLAQIILDSIDDDEPPTALYTLNVHEARMLARAVLNVARLARTVLDPFAGSGTTLEAAMLEVFNVTGIEREADYLPLIHARIERVTAKREARAEAEGGALFPIDGDAS